MSSEEKSILKRILIELFIIVVVRIASVVVASLLISHGLNILGFDVPSNAIGFLLFGIYFINIALTKIKSNVSK